MKRVLWTGVFFLTLIGMYAQTVSLDQAIQGVAKDIEQQVPRGVTLSVVNINAGSAGLSQYIIDELTGLLVRSRRFKVLDRGNVEIILKEHNFQMSGYVADASMAGIGLMLGAQSVVTGSLQDAGSAYRLTVRCLNVKTAQVESMYQASISKQDAQIAYWLKAAAPPAQQTTANTPKTAAASLDGVWEGKFNDDGVVYPALFVFEGVRFLGILGNNETGNFIYERGDSQLIVKYTYSDETEFWPYTLSANGNELSLTIDNSQFNLSRLGTAGNTPLTGVWEGIRDGDKLRMEFFNKTVWDYTLDNNGLRVNSGNVSSYTFTSPVLYFMHTLGGEVYETWRVALGNGGRTMTVVDEDGETFTLTKQAAGKPRPGLAPPAPPPPPLPLEPSWYTNLPITEVDALFGIGEAKMVVRNIGMQVADYRARTSLAFTLKANIQAMIDAYVKESGNISESLGLQFVELICQQLTDAKLTGVSVYKTGISESGINQADTTYCAVMLNNHAAAKIAADAVNAVIASNSGTFTRFRQFTAADRIEQWLDENRVTPKAVTE